METNEMTKTQRNAIAFQAKNQRRKNGKASVDRPAFLDARTLRRARLDGAFGNLDGEDYDILAVGTSGSRADDA